MAVRSAQLVQRENLFRYLVATSILGLMFLGVKATEYYIDYRESLIPGQNFKLEDTAEKSDFPAELPAYDSQPPAFASTVAEAQPKALYTTHAKLFFLFYFMMTGIHATHMVIGIAILLILAVRVKAGKYQFQNHNTIEMIGLYWHFVDVVWIFLYPLLYLIR
jgi:cytochrome c oxidase subunit 3